MVIPRLSRRSFLAMSGIGVAAACATPGERRAAIAPIDVREKRVDRVTVCLRPFRAAGPRIEGERVGDKLVVHNYGHGGSGWSLSWGSSEIAVREALSGEARDIAVLGCGALGLTTALLLLRRGASVTIYARDMPMETRSMRATGSWSPDSRIASIERAPAFGDAWEAMCRSAFAQHRAFIGAEGDPVNWTDWYYLSDGGQQRAGPAQFAAYQQRVRDLLPPARALSASENPFRTAIARVNSTMTFNVTAYARRLQRDVLTGGARFVQADFHAPSELAALPQRTIVNCSGYGARALWGDETIIPVRGQISWLGVQPAARYGLYYRHTILFSRGDGVVVQRTGDTDAWGFNDDDETPRHEETLDALARVAPLFNMRAALQA